MINFLDSGSATAAEHMNKDKELLLTLPAMKEPLFHFYEWQGQCATFGHFIAPSDYLDMQEIANKGIQLARRPTGGGIVFHFADFAFSLLVPASHSCCSSNTLANYAFVNALVAAAIKDFLQSSFPPTLFIQQEKALAQQRSHFCMAQTTHYDLLLEGKKVAGAAQRRTKFGFLHQGTISLGMISQSLLSSLLLPTKIYLQEEMAKTSYYLLGSKYTEKQLAEARLALKILLHRSLLDF